MQHTLIRLFVALLCWLPISVSAATQSIHIEWGYTPPSQPAVTGFKLYQEGTYVCQSLNPTATAMDCVVTLTATTTNFTLTAVFNDGTESPHSSPFPFTLASTPAGAPPSPPAATTPPPATGSKLFSFSWDTTANLSSLKGYKIYLNNALLCESSNSADTSIACKADLIQGLMTFSMTQVATDDTESTASNLLVFDPTAYPELFNTKLVTFTWDYTGAADITGFRVYQNNSPICQILDPTANQLACTVDINSTPVSYGVTSINANGTESSISNLLVYNADTSTTPTSTAPLQAVITAAPLSGTAPLSVDFNGISSTGNISSFQWDFGDGSTSMGNTATHAYTTEGTYTAKLTVTDTNGQTSVASTTITASPTVTPATPPTAAISSSTAAGPSPLTVTFDGSASTAAYNATITAYSWSFGDGSSATGASTAHTYATAGTYSTTLTVTDSKGLSSSISTPIVVTAAIIQNKVPTAVINATPASGSAPLTVTFDGSSSTDPDGSIASYIWNFGDGSSASGKTATHIYTTEATFNATLQVTDNQGADSAANTTITVNPKPPATPSLNIEMGEISATSNWGRVGLKSTFQNPIVIAGPASFNNTDPGTIRLRNIDSTGFDIKFTEWNYLDGIHPEETVSYLVMEKGRFTLPDGSSIEAGSFTGTTSFKTVPFSTAFAKPPVVLTAIASTNEADTISGRIKNIGLSNFAYYFREQEKNTNTHANETVNFIAWEPGKGSIGLLQYEIANTAKAVTNNWYAITYQTLFNQTPMILADIQTTNDTDPTALRIQQSAATGFQIKAEEEKSKSTNITHTAEIVGYLALNQVEEKMLATFTWDYDSAQEVNISGFQIQANGEQICATNDTTARQLDCEITKPAGTTTFAILAVELSGSNSAPSNTITYSP